MMPSMSRIDMVALHEETAPRQLQVCGKLELRDGNPPLPVEVYFLVVVRQGDDVVPLRETKTVEHREDDWKFLVDLKPQQQLTTTEPAVVSAVVILKQEPAGLEVLSWVQPVRIEDKWVPPSASSPPAQPVSIPGDTEGALTTDQSVSSSLTIVEDGPAGAGTHHWSRRLETLTVPATPTT
jgi:hypothetical protein